MHFDHVGEVTHKLNFGVYIFIIHNIRPLAELDKSEVALQEETFLLTTFEVFYIELVIITY